MSCKLINVPRKSARIPVMMSTMSRTRMSLKGPNLSGHRTHISMMPGNAIPRADKQNAPNREMNSSSRGTSTARMTVVENSIRREH
ncbi:hypothetical protein WDU94_001138 [Cyamophila willieti]